MFASIRKSYNHTIYASYLGYITQAIINNLSPLLFLIFQDAFGLTLPQITLLITLNFAVQMAVDLLSVRFIKKAGYRTCIVLAHFCAAVGLVGICLFPMVMDPFAGLIVSAVISAIVATFVAATAAGAHVCATVVAFAVFGTSVNVTCA